MIANSKYYLAHWRGSQIKSHVEFTNPIKSQHEFSPRQALLVLSLLRHSERITVTFSYKQNCSHVGNFRPCGRRWATKTLEWPGSIQFCEACPHKKIGHNCLKLSAEFRHNSLLQTFSETEIGSLLFFFFFAIFSL